MEHRLITGGEQFLPFAQSCVRKLKKLGLPYADQSYEVEGVSIKVRIEPGHEYISIDGGGSLDYVAESTHEVPPDLADPLPMHKFGQLTPNKADQSVKIKAAKATLQAGVYTDWKGKSGTVLLYDTGSPVRHRIGYPSRLLDAKPDIIYNETVISTNGRGVLGAGILTTAKGERVLIYATCRNSKYQATEFYYRILNSEPPADADFYISTYSPHFNNPEFISNYTEMAPAYPDQWCFSPDGREAVTATIKANIQRFRHGFITHIKFFEDPNGESTKILMQEMDNTDQTYRISNYTDQVEFGDMGLGRYLGHTDTTIRQVYKEDTHEFVRTETYVVEVSSGYDVAPYGYSHTKSNGVETDFLIGADFDAAGALHVLTGVVGNPVENETWVLSHPPFIDVSGWIYVAGSPYVESHHYRVITDTTKEIEVDEYYTQEQTYMAGPPAPFVIHADNRSQGVTFKLHRDGVFLYEASVDNIRTVIDKSGFSRGSLTSYTEKYGRRIDDGIFVQLDARTGSVLCVKTKSYRGMFINFIAGTNTSFAESDVWVETRGIINGDTKCTNLPADIDTVVSSYIYGETIYDTIETAYCYLLPDSLIILIGEGIAAPSQFGATIKSGIGKNLSCVSAKKNEQVYCLDLVHLPQIVKQDVTTGHMSVMTYDNPGEKRIVFSAAKAVKGDAGEVVIYETKTIPRPLSSTENPVHWLKNLRLAAKR